MAIDVMSIVADNMKRHICPIYTEEDYRRDIESISECFGIELHREDEFLIKTIPKIPLVYTEKYASKMFGMTSGEFRSLVNKKHPLCQSRIVRKFLLDKFGGNTVEWARFYCKKHNCNIDNWFIEALMPFESSEYIPVDKIARVFSCIKRNAIRPTGDLLQFLSDYKSQICKDPKTVMDLIIDRFADNGKRKKACIDVFDSDERFDNNMMTVLLSQADRDFKPGTFMRCKAVYEKYRLEWLPSGKLTDFVDFIKGDYDRFLEELSPHDVRMALEEICDLYILDEEVRECMMLNFYECASCMMQSFDNLLTRVERILEFHNLDMDLQISYYFDIFEIEDNDTDLTHRDIERFIGYRIGHDAEDWRFWFNNMANLMYALEEEGLELREDSQLCKDYIEYEEYDGPELIEAVGDPLRSVVLMMKEMGFLYTRTRYGDFVKCCNSKEKAKLFAIYELLINIPNDLDDLYIPPRLYRLLGQCGASFLDDYKVIYNAIETNNEYFSEFSEFSEDFSEDFDF